MMLLVACVTFTYIFVYCLSRCCWSSSLVCSVIVAFWDPIYTFYDYIHTIIACPLKCHDIMDITYKRIGIRIFRKESMVRNRYNYLSPSVKDTKGKKDAFKATAHNKNTTSSKPKIQFLSQILATRLSK